MAIDNVKIGGAFIEVTADTKKVHGQVKQLETGVKRATTKMKAAFAGVGGTMAAMFGGAAVLLGLKKGFDAFIALDKGMRNVNTIARVTQKELGKIKDSVVALSGKLGTPTSELTGALYQTLSAGVAVADSMMFLEAATKSGIAGLTSTETAVDGLTTVMNAFHIEAERVTEVADIMFTTVRLGKTTFEELSASYNLVAALAATAGIQFWEISAAVASLTKQGVPTSIAMTQLRAVIIAMTKELGDGWRETFTFQQGLEEMTKRAGGSQNALKDMIGRIEGVNAVLGLTGVNAITAASDLKEMENSIGAMGTAFEEQEKAVSRSIDKIKVKIENSLIKAFELAVTQVGAVVDAAGNLRPELKRMDRAVEDSTSAWQDFSTAISWWYKNVILAVPRAIGWFIQLANKTDVWRSTLVAVGLATLIPKREFDVSQSGLTMARDLTSQLNKNLRETRFPPNMDEKVKEILGSFDAMNSTVSEIEAKISELESSMGDLKPVDAAIVAAEIKKLADVLDFSAKVGETNKELERQKQFLNTIIGQDDLLLEKHASIKTALENQNLSYEDRIALIRKLVGLEEELNELKVNPEVLEASIKSIEADELEEEAKGKGTGEVEVAEMDALADSMDALVNLQLAATTSAEDLSNTYRELAGAIRLIQGAFGSHTVAFKAMAVIEATVATYLAAAKALLVQPPPLGIALAATVTAAGLLNVGKIISAHDGGTFENGRKIASFAGGADFIVGAGFPNDSFRMNVESGERVQVTPKSAVDAMKSQGNNNGALGDVLTAINNLNENLVSVLGDRDNTFNLEVNLDGRELTTEIQEIKNQLEREGEDFEDRS